MSTFKNSTKFKHNLTALSLATFFSAVGCMLFGYVMMPVAAGFFASLLLCERKENRVFSYVIPLVVFVLNFFINGYFSLEAIAYVALGATLYFIFVRNLNKAQGAFWLSLQIVIFISLSACLVAFDEIGALKLASIKGFYSEQYYVLKEYFINVITSVATRSEAGIINYSFSRSVAEEFFISVIKFLPAAIISFAFVSTGIAMKIFSRQAELRTKEASKIDSWSFVPSTFVGVFYLVVAVLALFVTDGVFADSVLVLDTLFSLVFFYMGVKFFLTVFRYKGKSGLVIFILLLAIFAFGAFASRLISYIGVYFTVASNRTSSENLSV